VTQVKVPDIGDFTDVPVIEVLVAVGDEVEADQGLITLESDKATMEVPAPHAGVVEELLVEEGDEVSEGTPVAVVSDASGDDGNRGDDGELGDDGERGDDEKSGDAGQAESEESGETGESGDDDPGETDQPDDEAGGGGEPESAHLPAEADRAGGADVYASPSVRRIARQRGIDLGRIEGTGRKGRITVEDVENFEGSGDEVAGGRDGATAGTGLPGLEVAPWPEVDHARHGEVERVELSRIKQISGPNLARNWVYIPHVTHHDEADITGLEAFRKQVNSEQDVKVTMVALLLKAVVPVLRQYPEFNSSLDGDGLILKHYYHLGFAADTPNGLLVPVIRDVDKKGLLEVAGELVELSGKAREGKLGAAEMSGATFTISSLGGIGGTGFTPIINAPQVAILGVTRAAFKPVWDPEGEQFLPRLMVPLSLSYDHRVVDGAAAARFCVSLVKVLEDFRRIVL
jgi:pyruvate dehydrogenase E2 component (dihydrolipoamide acetyltransferase)